MPLYNGCTKRIKLNRRIFCLVGGLTHLEMKRKRNLKVWLTKCHEIQNTEEDFRPLVVIIIIIIIRFLINMQLKDCYVQKKILFLNQNIC